MRATLMTLVLCCSSLAWADAPADAPIAAPVVLTPDQAKAEAKRVLTCEADLKDCKAAGKVEPVWLVVGVVAGVAAGFAIGLGVAQVKR